MVFRKEVSEMTIYDRGKNKSFLSIFALISFAVLALPCLALGAGRASGSSGSFRASSGASMFRVQSGSKPISVSRVQASERICRAFTVVDSLMETDSLVEMVA